MSVHQNRWKSDRNRCAICPVQTAPNEDELKIMYQNKPSVATT